MMQTPAHGPNVPIPRIADRADNFFPIDEKKSSSPKTLHEYPLGQRYKYGLFQLKSPPKSEHWTRAFQGEFKTSALTRRVRVRADSSRGMLLAEAALAPPAAQHPRAGWSVIRTRRYYK
jgi:hypothetical protein